MVIEPWIRDNVCLNAHPQGCFAQVKDQMDYVVQQGRLAGSKRVLVIGASNGYGLATRIVSTFGTEADTLGVAYERPAKGKRTASAGWYNTEAFTHLAHEAGYQAWNINGDAFSTEIKEEILDSIMKNLGQIDLLIYSIAAPRRQDPITGELYNSVIKPLGQPYTAKTVDFLIGQVSEMTTPAGRPHGQGHGW